VGSVVEGTIEERVKGPGLVNAKIIVEDAGKEDPK